MQTPDGIRILGDIQRLELKPDDVLVLTSDQPMTIELCERLKRELQAQFEGRRVLVLSDGLKIGAINAPRTESAAG